jgi:hypothetical protein
MMLIFHDPEYVLLTGLNGFKDYIYVTHLTWNLGIQWQSVGKAAPSSLRKGLSAVLSKYILNRLSHLLRHHLLGYRQLVVAKMILKGCRGFKLLEPHYTPHNRPIYRDCEIDSSPAPFPRIFKR